MSRNFPLLLVWTVAALLVVGVPGAAWTESDPPLERRPEDVDDLKRLEAEKKPDEKQLVPELGHPGRGDDLADLVVESERNLKEIQRLLEEIESSLAQKETGAPTQKRQREAVEKMEKLLETLEKSCSQGSSSSSSQPQSSGESQEKQQSSEDSSSSQKEKEKEAREQQKSSAKLQESEAERRAGKVENDKNRDSLTPEARARALREQLLQYSRRWGLLPPKLRDEMLSSTGREAPQEYLEIISRYYKRLTDYYQESPPPSK